MAGHSKFHNIKHRKGAQDAKRAKIFTKITREIFIATKLGDPDPNFNSRLRTAIAAAKSANMPKDKIDAAIKKASNPAETQNYNEIRYEGYGPGGVAFIVEVLTDNKNRSAGEVRTAFTKSGGSLGESGSVGYMFNRVGIIVYPSTVCKEEDMLNAALEAEVQDCITDDDIYEIITPLETFNEILEALEAKFGTPDSAEVTYRPDNYIDVDEANAQKIIRLIDTLEDNDDVQKVVGNFAISDEIMNKL